MALLGRIIVILFALWLATVAAGLVLSIGFLGAEWSALSGDPAERVIFWGATFIATSLTGALIFVPVLIAVVLAEAFSVRSLLVYVAGGAALMLLGYFGADFGRSYEESIDAAPKLMSRGLELVAVAGIAFGLVYWAVAGRNAARWRTRL